MMKNLQLTPGQCSFLNLNNFVGFFLQLGSTKFTVVRVKAHELHFCPREIPKHIRWLRLRCIHYL